MTGSEAAEVVQSERLTSTESICDGRQRTHSNETGNISEASREERKTVQRDWQSNGALDLYKLREVLYEEQRRRAAAEAAPRIAEDRLLAAEERASKAEALQKEAEAARDRAILECRRDRRAAAEEIEKVRAEAADQIREAEQLVTSAESEQKDEVAKVIKAAQDQVEEIRACALEQAREEVWHELEEARNEAAAAEASLSDVQKELESTQAEKASNLLAGNQTLQGLARECKALQCRIDSMAEETRQKVMDARAMEAAKVAKELNELKDANVVMKARVRKAEERAEKAERRGERSKSQSSALDGSVANSTSNGATGQPLRRCSTMSSATEKRMQRAQEEISHLKTQVQGRTKEFNDLKLEFLNRERDIRLAAAHQVETARFASDKAKQSLCRFAEAVRLAVALLKDANLEIPSELEDCINKENLSLAEIADQSFNMRRDNGKSTDSDPTDESEGLASNDKCDLRSNTLSPVCKDHTESACNALETSGEVCALDQSHSNRSGQRESPKEYYSRIYGIQTKKSYPSGPRSLSATSSRSNTSSSNWREASGNGHARSRNENKSGGKDRLSSFSNPRENTSGREFSLRKLLADTDGSSSHTSNRDARVPFPPGVSSKNAQFKGNVPNSTSPCLHPDVDAKKRERKIPMGSTSCKQRPVRSARTQLG
uniref:Uncharacterized protein n=1 Tax=Tetraselmis sp. GSL018 TaxID=582737 RepID=A0A061SJX2_9CHLO|eukprot:CAMPEP_0177585194 /NCGR_PEP_ID=MMETSP0419_2-20121207/4339_1 /TAXON_ID=582737 /ORGANISM="Tetraselmis sp., Strain GSL018" /LENGTH=662 /DNA_ID=CAMNT_0019074863 /DNA_START=302 /DNA_END=2290 /DNA_ORIENTATION=-